MERVKARALEAQQHQDIPFEQVVEIAYSRCGAWRTVRCSRRCLRGRTRRSGALELPGVEVGAAGAGGDSGGEVRSDADVCRRPGGRIVGGVEYATALFERGTIERYLGLFRGGC